MKRLLAIVGLLVAVIGVSGGIATAERTYQEAVVSHVTGGGIIADDGRMQWYVPPESYAYDLKIKYTPKTRAHFPGQSWTYSTLILAADPFTLDINVLDGGEGVDIDKPMTLTLKYNPLDLGGRSEAGLHVAKYDGSRDMWFPLDSTVDTVHHLVTAQNNEAGDYGLIVDNVAPTPTPAPEPTAAPLPTAVPTPSIPMSSGIAGKVFYDRDGNGIMDGEDFPIGGATLRISSGSWSATTTSSADGSYAFWSLRESAYLVEILVGSEWAFTSPNVVSDIRVSGQADSKGTADFGMWYHVQ